MTRWFVIFAAVLVCAAGSAQAKVFDNYIEMYAAKYLTSDGIGYQGGFTVNIEGLNSSDLTIEGVGIMNSEWGGPEEMNNDSSGEYYLDSDEDMAFEDLTINGTWYIDVVTSDGTGMYDSIYSWTISGVTPDTWNAIPSITSPEDMDVTTNLRPTFTWTVDSINDGARLFVKITQDGEDDTFKYQEELDPNTQLEWMPDFDLSPGTLDFTVFYAIPLSLQVSYDAEASAYQGTPGGDIVAWADAEAYFVAADSVEIEIVPEPATISLLGLGALAIIRRKRS